MSHVITHSREDYGVIRLHPGEKVQFIQCQPINYTDWYLCRDKKKPSAVYVVTSEFVADPEPVPSFLRRWFA